MLCDEIIAFPTTAAGARVLSAGRRTAIEQLTPRLREAVRYVLLRDAVMLVQTISDSKPHRFLAALDLCRLPFPGVWVEFAYQDRADWLRDAAGRGVRAVVRDGAPPPTRLGFYMEQLDARGQDILVHPSWVHDDGMVSLGHLALRIDTAAAAVPRDDHDGGVWFASVQGSRAAPSDDWNELARHIRYGIPEFMLAQWDEYRPDRLDEVMDLAVYDLRAEWRFALALLTVLNSRNVVAVGDPVDYQKLNRRRQAKGRAALLAHREIRLSLSRVQRARLGTAGNNLRELQAQLVTGHWKLRRHGLYWWSSHIRGAGTPAHRVRVVRA